MRFQPTSEPTRPSSNIDATQLDDTFEPYRISRWTRYFVRPILITTLILSLITATLFVVNNIAPDPRWLWLLPLLGIILLETIYTTQWANHPDRLILSHSIYRIVEIFLILIGVRIVTWFLFGEGNFSSRQDVLFYLRNPGEVFLTPIFLMAVVLVILIWQFGILFTNLFNQLDISEYEVRYYSLPLAARKTRIDDKPIRTSRGVLIKRFTALWIYGGILIAICVGLSSLDISAYRFDSNPFALTKLGLNPIVLMAMLLYFFSGFLLLSHARLSELNAYWLLNHVEKDANIEAGWKRNSLIILGVIGLLAAFVPIKSGLPIATLINYLLIALTWIINLVFGLFALILVLILSLFGSRNEGQPPVQAEPFVPPQLPAAAPPPPLSETTTFLLSSMFWSVLIGLVVLAALYFLRERDERPSRASTRRLLTNIKLWIIALWGRLRHQVAVIQTDLAERLSGYRTSAEAPPTPDSPFKFIRVNGLSPRDKIRYFYLSTVKRATQKGVGRDDSETPLEYIEDLKTAWPEAEEELDLLTQAFLEARYSRKPIEDEEAGLLKNTWKQVKSTLRKGKSDTGK